MGEHVSSWSRGPPAARLQLKGGHRLSQGMPCVGAWYRAVQRIEMQGNRHMSTSMQEDLWSAPTYEESNKPFELIDAGVYKLRLKTWEEPVPVLAKYDDTGKKKRSKFVFEVIEDARGDDDWAGTTVSKWMTISMNEKSAMYPYVKALLGGEVDPKLRIVPSLIEGRELMATITHSEKDAEGRVWPEITAPLPVTKPRGRNRSTTSSEPTAPEDVASFFDAEVDPANPPF